MKRLTKATVDASAPRGHEFIVWDDRIPGFGLRVRPTGAKTYVYRYGAGRRGKYRRVTIGRHGPITAVQARLRAEELRAQVGLGGDPAADKAATRSIPTVEAIAERYFDEHAVPHKRPSSVEQDRNYLRRVILPALGHARIDRVTRADVAALHHARRATPTDANRALALLSKIMSLAELWGFRAPGTNPARGIRRYRERRRDRFLAPDELARLGEVFVQAERQKTVPIHALGALGLLIFTGARRSEILMAKWEQVDLGAGVLRVPLPKEGKPKQIRLGPPAIAILRRLPRLEGNPYVIVGQRARAHFVGIQNVWETIRAKAGLDDVRIHDLRHTYSSVVLGGGSSLPALGALLGHASPSTTQRYAHLLDDPLRAVADDASKRLDEAMRVKRGQAASTDAGSAPPRALDRRPPVRSHRKR